MICRSGPATLSFYFLPLPSHLAHVPRYKFRVWMPPLPTKAQCSRRRRSWFCDSFRTPLFRAVSHLPAWLRNLCLESPRGPGLDCALRQFSVTEWIPKRTASPSVWERRFILALSEEGNPQGPGDCHLWPPMAAELALVWSCGRVRAGGQGGEPQAESTARLCTVEGTLPSRLRPASAWFRCRRLYCSVLSFKNK